MNKLKNFTIVSKTNCHEVYEPDKIKSEKAQAIVEKTFRDAMNKCSCVIMKKKETIIQL